MVPQYYKGLLAIPLTLVMLLYIFIVSPKVFLISVCIITLGITGYYGLTIKLRKDHQKSALLEYRLLKSVTDFILGVKELKLDANLLDWFWKHEIIAISQQIRTNKIALQKTQALAQSYVETFLYIFMSAIVLTHFFITKIETTQVLASLSAALLLIGPLSEAVTFGDASLAIKTSIKNLEQSIAALEQGSEPPATRPSNISFQGLSCRGVCFQYQKGDNTFTLGPISLEIKPGEQIILSGGNGSGKSTFMKLLLGLYNPESGYILFNQLRVQTSGNMGL